MYTKIFRALSKEAILPEGKLPLWHLVITSHSSSWVREMAWLLDYIMSSAQQSDATTVVFRRTRVLETLYALARSTTLPRVLHEKTFQCLRIAVLADPQFAISRGTFAWLSQAEDAIGDQGKLLRNALLCANDLPVYSCGQLPWLIPCEDLLKSRAQRC
jgi:hypothetical protein